MSDRISRLPDELLCQILSYLPPNYAAAAAVLSTRWRSLFASLPTIHLDDSGYHFVQIPRFRKLVMDAMRSRTLSNSPILEFSLRCRHPYYVNRLLKFLPLCSNSLQILKLEGIAVSTSSTISTSFCLPNLRVCHLKDIYVNIYLQRLVKESSQLEDLQLFECELHFGRSENKIFELSIPTLKKLGIINCSGDHEKLVFDTPNLEWFHYDKWIPRHMSCSMKTRLVSLIKASICVDLNSLSQESYESECVEQAKLINQLCNAKFLYLHGDSFAALSDSVLSLLPTFPNLTHVELEAWIPGESQWDTLHELLENSPNLEVLVFLEGWFIDSLAITYTPVHVPICLSTRLKKIEFRSFEGYDPEFELIQYFLQSGKVLESIAIPRVSREVHTRLLNLPRSSKTCQINNGAGGFMFEID